MAIPDNEYRQPPVCLTDIEGSKLTQHWVAEFINQGGSGLREFDQLFHRRQLRFLFSGLAIEMESHKVDFVEVEVHSIQADVVKVAPRFVVVVQLFETHIASDRCTKTDSSHRLSKGNMVLGVEYHLVHFIHEYDRTPEYFFCHDLIQLLKRN